MTTEAIFLDCDDIEVCFITYNEEQFIEASIRSTMNFFERFSILDMCSTDRTVAIAKDLLGPRLHVILRPRDDLLVHGFAHARNELASVAGKPWLFHLDADELVANDLSDKKVLISAEGIQDAARVTRRNLLGPPPERYDPASVAGYDCSSVERHVRIYKNNVDAIRWHGFIHEEIWIDTYRGSDFAAQSNIVLDHLSVFRPWEQNVHKEQFYAWLLLKVHFNEDLQKGMSPAYYDDLVNKDMDRFRSMAKEFAARHGLSADWL